MAKRTLNRHVSTEDADIEARAVRLCDGLSTLLRLHQQKNRNKICCYGISSTQSIILDALSRHGVQRLTVLSHLTGLDKAAVSRAVNQLVEMGYMQRNANVPDRRSVALQITEAGAALRSKIRHDAIDQQVRFLSALDVQTGNSVIVAIETVVTMLSENDSDVRVPCC